jgi:phospholipid transport system substrate-binding protein
MTRSIFRSGAAALALGLLGVPAAAQQAAPQAATPAQTQAAAQFVDRLANQAFGILRDRSLSKEAARGRFRELLKQNFALDEAGLRLIRRYRATLTPQQLSTYRATLPDYLVNTYADRLYDFAAASVKVLRTVPRGTRGDVDVYTTVSDPNGGKPIDAIWTVKTGGPRPLIMNLTVNGVNVALTQEADFSAYIDKNGFDALLAFMRQTT